MDLHDRLYYLLSTCSAFKMDLGNKGGEQIDYTLFLVLFLQVIPTGCR